MKSLTALFMASILSLAACAKTDEAKPVDYWMHHFREMEEVGQSCMMSGGKNVNCENIGIASARWGNLSSEDRDRLYKADQSKSAGIN